MKYEDVRINEDVWFEQPEIFCFATTKNNWYVKFWKACKFGSLTRERKKKKSTLLWQSLLPLKVRLGLELPPLPPILFIFVAKQRKYMKHTEWNFLPEEPRDFERLWKALVMNRHKMPASAGKCVTHVFEINGVFQNKAAPSISSSTGAGLSINLFLLNLRDIELKHYSSSLLSNRSTHGPQKKHVYARMSLRREEIWCWGHQSVDEDVERHGHVGFWVAKHVEPRRPFKWRWACRLASPVPGWAIFFWGFSCAVWINIRDEEANACIFCVDSSNQKLSHSASTTSALTHTVRI